MKIYFCEACGASVPLQEVVGGRATTSDGKVFCSQHLPGGADGDLKLYFCDACGVSIPLQDVITGTATTEGDRTLCPACVRREKAEGRSGDRFQLYFCDSCNTSIPQSHVVTGRALVRGGKTYCENCRGRAARRMSPVVPVLAVVALAAIALVLLFAFEWSPRAEPAGPDPVALVAGLEHDMDARLDQIEEDGRTAYGGLERRLQQAREALAVEVGRLDAQVKLLGDLSEERDALLVEVKGLRAEVDRLKPLEATVARIPAMEEEIARLRGALDAASQATPPAAPEKAEPKPAEPAPPPAVVPEEVRQRIERLASPDSGIRFSAAVELGKLGHAAAAGPLGEILRKDEDLFVRRAAARALGEINARDGIPALIDALTDSEVYVSLQAAKSLEAMSGKDFGFKETLSMAQRRAIQARYRKWYEESEPK